MNSFSVSDLLLFLFRLNLLILPLPVSQEYRPAPRFAVQRGGQLRDRGDFSGRLSRGTTHEILGRLAPPSVD
jgi:hypothetical protein